MSALEMVKLVGNPSTPTLARRRGRWRSAFGLALLAGGATSFAGCGSVAGPEYTGEVGLELRGEVESLAHEDLVPALAFLGEDAIYLVDGEVTGEFPKHFGMRVDEAPPEGALRAPEKSFGEDMRVAAGFLVMAPKDHPPMLTSEEAFSPPDVIDISDRSEPDPETGEFTVIETRCSADGKDCETATLACETKECETVLVEGWTPGGNPVGGSSGTDCLGSACLAYTESCEEEACTRSIKYCERSNSYDVVWSEGTVDECKVVSIEGTAPRAGLGGFFAQDLVVMFVTKDVEAEGIQFEKGYNVIQASKPDKNEWAQSLSCALQARADVASDAEGDSPEEFEARISAAVELCPKVKRYERLSDPVSHELQISLGEPSPIF